MSPRAEQAIHEATVIVGYDTYLDLIKPLLAGKAVIGTGMMQEIDRCQAAVDQALAGKKVAVISSGDPGIYGMAGLVLELAMKHPATIRPAVDIIPGISAVSAAAAILGAPLMHDFVVLSLSDLLTPWEVIVKRAEMAAAGDFVIAIYNPKSKKRTNQIEQVQDILTCDLLAIDDLGSEPMMRGVTVGSIYHVISERHNASRPMILSTNCSVQQLYEKYEDRIAARLCDQSRMTIIEFVGTDVRRFAR